MAHALGAFGHVTQQIMYSSFWKPVTGSQHKKFVNFRVEIFRGVVPQTKIKLN